MEVTAKYEKLSFREVEEFTQRAAVQLNPELTQTLFQLVLNFAMLKEENANLKVENETLKTKLDNLKNESEKNRK